MAAGKLLARALSFLSPINSPVSHVRHLCTAATAAAGDLKPSLENSVTVLDFLQGRGLGEEVLAGFAPRLLDSKVGKDLPAKFDLFLTLGFSVPEAAKAMRYQSLLCNLSFNTIRRNLDALRAIVSDDADLRRIIDRANWILHSSYKIQRMVDNMSKLRGWGLPDTKIRSLLVTNPRFFQLKPQGLEDAADRAEAEFGFRRDSKTFIDAVFVLWRTNKSTMESKFRIFERFGWERSDVMFLFKSQPYCINLAEATLVKRLDFLMKEVGYDSSYIANRPAMLAYSLEKRVGPRFELMNALKSKNLLPEGLSFYSTWCISETVFMEKYVIKFMKEEQAFCNTYISTVATPKKQASGFVHQSLSLSKAQAI